MTERPAPSVPNGLSNPTLHPEAFTTSAIQRHDAASQRDAVLQRSSSQSHQAMSLAAVVRHVMALAACAGPSAETQAPADESALRRLNGRLDATLDICFQLDAARRQLHNAISTQRELETVLEMLAARVDAGQASPDESRQVASLVSFGREKVAEAVSEWNRTGRCFARHTRLLPTQLDGLGDTPEPLSADEMDRLAEACLWTPADVHFSLRQRANAWSQRRCGAALEPGRALEDFHAWISRMEEARSQAAADFSAARETYLQCVLGLDREHASLVRARSLRRSAEVGFRCRFASAHAFAASIVEESRRMHSVLALQAHRSAARHRLYALAGLLPSQFGLAGPVACH